MKINDIIKALEELAPFSLQEDYDNAGLILGDPGADITGCLVCLDVTEAVILEAAHTKCNLVLSHHPVIFRGLKKLTGQTMTERIIELAIRENIALCSMHTNLDNVAGGVNRMLAQKLGLVNLSILKTTPGLLRKLVTFCPLDHAQNVREAIFSAGAGHIGEYDQCSYNSEGQGSFRAGNNAHPFVGKKGELHFEPEVRIETIFPVYLQRNIIAAMIDAHPYEEVAYDIYPLDNEFNRAGAGMIGDLPGKVSEKDFLQTVKETLKTPFIRHSPLTGRMVSKVAVCGGSGSFMIPDAIRQKAEIFVTGDVKYHQFFEAEGKLVIVDAGHYETEQFTCNLLADYLKEKFAKFAVRISETPVNPVNYF
jgi:dinuclear metal center YbgI/SA1388 family protein